MGYYVGMDIGGTSARIKAVSEECGILGEHTGKGCTFNTSGYAVSSELYREVVLTSLEKWSLRPEKCMGICVAASGLDSLKLKDECAGIFLDMGFSKEILTMYNDCEILLKLSKRPALVLVSGTGSIAYGSISTGEMVRCGGWSHIVSDEGSAMDIGKQVLRTIGNHIDGRCSCPILYHLFAEKSEIRTLDELDRYINEEIMDKPKIAGFAVLAEKAARQGDENAKKILEYSADALFLLVKDVYKKVNEYGEVPENLFLWGSVLTKNHIIANFLKEKVNRSFPEIEVQYPKIEAIDIAIRTAMQGRAH